MSGVELPGAPPSGGPVRRAVRAQEKRRKKRKRRSWVAVLVSLAILAVAGGAIYYGVKPIIASLTEPDDYPGPGTGSVTVRIPDGSTGRGIGKVLVEKGVVKSIKGFVDAANKDPRAASIRPGSYEMRLKMSSPGAIDLLSNPKNRIFKTLTIPEGKRVTEVVDLMVRAGFPKKDVQAALADPASLGVPAWAKGKKDGVRYPTEGLLFPSTYEIEPGDTAANILSRMVQQTLDELVRAGVPAGSEWKVLTEASIIQAEGGTESDFPKIARVLDNRTKKGMLFQLDSTVSYATQRFGVTTTDAERASSSRYNTYKYKGYPLGPICNPGAAAIEAAMKPAKGTWIYFVTVNPDTGETKFGTTEAEKAAMDAEWHAWLAKNKKK